jgi:hypothetical protein
MGRMCHLFILSLLVSGAGCYRQARFAVVALEPEGLARYDALTVCRVSFWGTRIDHVAERRWLEGRSLEDRAAYLARRLLFGETYEAHLRARALAAGVDVDDEPRAGTVVVHPTMTDWDWRHGSMRVRFIGRTTGAAAAIIRVEGEIVDELAPPGLSDRDQVKALAEAMADATLRFATGELARR